jgi:hypothetical protein
LSVPAHAGAPPASASENARAALAAEKETREGVRRVIVRQLKRRNEAAG